MATRNTAVKPGKNEKIPVRLPPPQRISITKSSESNQDSAGLMKPKEPRFVPFEPYKAAVSPLFFTESSSNLETEVSKETLPKSSSSIAFPKTTKLPHEKIALVLPNVLSQVDEKKTDEISRSTENCPDKNKILQLEAELQKLKDDKNCLESQLHNQTKINAELKKLLVASVGEDLECRVQFLTEDKIKLAQDVNHYVQRLLADHEELEKLSIQCDVWRSKFLASSLIVDELAKWKAKLYHRYDETLEALHELLEEHQHLKEQLRSTYSYLQSLHKSFDRTSALSFHNHNTPKTVLDLSVCTKKLSSSLHLRLLGSSAISENTDHVSEEMTSGEQKAQLVSSS